MKFQLLLVLSLLLGFIGTSVSVTCNCYCRNNFYGTVYATYCSSCSYECEAVYGRQCSDLMTGTCGTLSTSTRQRYYNCRCRCASYPGGIPSFVGYAISTTCSSVSCQQTCRFAYTQCGLYDNESYCGAFSIRAVPSLIGLVSFIIIFLKNIF